MAPDPSTDRRVVVTGATGLIGTALCARLRSDGYRVTRLVRGKAGPDDSVWDPATGKIDAGALEGATAVVHLAGKGIADAKWTPQHKAEVLDSRVKGTTLLATALAALERKPAVLASGSAIGFYGDRGDDVLDETSPAGTGFLVDVVQAWEGSTKAAEAAGIRVAHLRTGIVQSTRGGALKQQLLPFKLGLGGRLGSGAQWVPWITLDDEVSAIVHVIEHAEVRGPVNLVGPDPVTNRAYTKALGRALKRPTLIPIPLPALRLLYTGQMVHEMLLSSARVMPGVLESTGFRYAHPQLDEALAALLRTHG